MDIFKESSDCLWLILESKRHELTFSTHLLREIDWKMRGLLSRIVTSGRPLSETIFIPIKGNLPSKYCAIDTVKTFNPERFEKNAEGLKAKNIFVLFENEKVRSQIKDSKLLKKCKCIEDSI